MIFEVPFNYRITGRKEGREINSKSARWEFARVDVPDVSSEEAPIVVEWLEADELTRSSLAADKAPVLAHDGRQHVRYYDGNHWLPVLACQVSGRGNHRLTAEQFGYLIQAGETVGPLAPPLNYHRRAVPRHVTDPYAEYQTVNFSDRSEQLARITKAYADFLVVDGMLYTLASEPRIIARISVRDIERPHSVMSYVGTVLDIVANKDFTMDSEWNMFPIDRFEEALSFARRRNARILQKEAFNGYNLRRAPIIDYPEHIDRADNGIVTIETYARSFVSAFDQLPRAEVDTSSIRLYADIRDGLEMLPDDHGIVMIEAAAATLLEKEHLPNRGGLSPKCYGFLKELLETAAARPVEVGMAVPGRGWSA